MIAALVIAGYDKDMSKTANNMEIFNREHVRLHRGRAAAHFHDHAFLMEEVADRLRERVEEIKRRFSCVLDLGCHTGQMGSLLKTDTLISADISHSMVAQASGLRVVAEEENLPFAPMSFDLVVSNLSLHWVNDLPGAMIQIHNSLKPDGLFLASMLGGDTLYELRDALMLAEIELLGGVSPRVSPFADVKDLGSLLQRANFALPVADSDTITVTYSDPWSLLKDLRGMGEGNAIMQRIQSFTSRRVLMRAMEIYGEKYRQADGKIPATFQVLYMTGWRPHESQQKPLKPGSATTRLADVLKTKEHKL